MSDFIFGFIVALLLAKSGADVILWRWITQRWKTFKEAQDQDKDTDNDGR